MACDVLRMLTGPVADDMFHWQATFCWWGVPRIYSLPTRFYPFKPPKSVGREMHILECPMAFMEMLRIILQAQVLLSICSLLTDPNPDDPLVPEMARMYKTDGFKYETTARSWTPKYAMG